MEKLNTLNTENLKPSKNSLFNNIKNLSQKTMQDAKNSTEKVFYELKTLEKTEESSNIILIIRYIFVFLLIFFILINILQSLKLLPDTIVGIFKPILLFFGHSIENTLKQTTDSSIDGTKIINNTTLSTLNPKLNPELNKIKNDIEKKEINNNIPQPDDSIDSIDKINKSRGNNKNNLGYCYVGSDHGYRSCIDVENYDDCLSGDIFPTKDICINPNLRQ